MSIYNKNAEVKVQTNNQDPVQDDNVILSVKDLHVWFELRRFGFGHAGYVKAVDGVSFDLHHGEAIAIGQVAAAELSAQILSLPAPEVARIEAIFQRAGLPTRRGQRRGSVVSR